MICCVWSYIDVTDGWYVYRWLHAYTTADVYNATDDWCVCDWPTYTWPILLLVQHIHLYDGPELLVRPLHYPVVDWSAVRSLDHRGHLMHPNPGHVLYATPHM